MYSGTPCTVILHVQWYSMYSDLKLVSNEIRRYDGNIPIFATWSKGANTYVCKYVSVVRMYVCATH